MTSRAPSDQTSSPYASGESIQPAPLQSREQIRPVTRYGFSSIGDQTLSLRPLTRRRERTAMLQATSDPWAGTRLPASLRYTTTFPGTYASITNLLDSFQPSNNPLAASTYSPFASVAQQNPRTEDWPSRRAGRFQDSVPSSPWGPTPISPSYTHLQSQQPGSQGWEQAWPGPPIRRSSSEETRLNQGSSNYYFGEASSSTGSLQAKAYPQRRPSNRDEFDGPSQLLDKPADSGYEVQEQELPQLPVTLYAQEQDDILSKVNERLSQSAFDFVARYQFPVPIEPDKRPVRLPADREWTEWVYLLKRLATKRRIPARVLYNGQIKQLITVLENSLEMRHAAKHQSRPLKDDRNILQLISAGLQVTKILKDASAMKYLDALYIQTEHLIQSRRVRPGFSV